MHPKPPLGSVEIPGIYWTVSISGDQLVMHVKEPCQIIMIYWPESPFAKWFDMNGVAYHCLNPGVDVANPIQYNKVPVFIRHDDIKP